MAIFEVQMSIPAFLAAQLRQVQGRQICLPEPYAFHGISIQAQRILFGANAIRHNVEDEFVVFHADSRQNPEPPYFAPMNETAKGFKTQIAQNIAIEFALTEDILNRPNQAAPIVYTLHLVAVITLAYYPVPAGGCVINRYFENVEWPEMPPLPPGLGVDIDALKEQVRKVVAAGIGGPATPFDFAAMLPTGMSGIANAGVSVDAGSRRIAFRADPAPGNDYNPIRWTNFYRGDIPDRLQGKDWSLFLEGKVLESMLTMAMERALKKKKPPGFRVSSIGSQYQNAGGIPRVTTTLHAFFDTPFGDHYQPLQITTDLSYDAPTRSIVVDVSLAEIEKLIDTISDFVDRLKYFAPPVWLLLDWAAGDDLDQLSGILGSLPTPSLGGFAGTKVSDSHYRFSLEISPPSMGDTRLSIHDIVALADGVAVVGALRDRPYTRSDLALDVGEFGWNARWFGCGQLSESVLDAAEENPFSVAYLYAEVALETTGTAPIYVCGAKVLNDPLHVFPSGAPGLTFDRTLLPCKLKITMGNPPAAYLNAPYDLEIMLATTAGMRLIRIPPPPELGDAAKSLILSQIRVNLSYCTRKVPEWFGELGRFDVNWIEDPLIDPPLEIIDGYVWNFAIQGLRQGQSATLIDQGSGAYIHAAAGAGAAVDFTALVPPGGNITLFRDASPGVLEPFGFRDIDVLRTTFIEETDIRSESEGSATIEAWQQPLLRAAHLNLQASCLALLPAPMFGPSAVAIVTPDALLAIDVSNPYRPQRIGIWPVPGIRGAQPWRDGLLAFGERGFLSVDGNGMASKPSTGCEPFPVADAAFADRFSYVLTDSSLDVRSLSLCKTVSSIPMEGGRSLHLAGDRLWVGGSGGIEVFDLSDPQTPRLLTQYPDADVTRLSDSGRRSDSVAAVLTDGSLRTFSLSDGRIQMVARAARPWFAEAVAVGRCLVRVKNDRQSVAVSLLGQRRSVVPK